jgi:SAM-dependent methyltransferase
MTDCNEKPLRKYSKPSGFYFEARVAYFVENAKLLQKALDANAIYASQSRRKRCKICAVALPRVGGFSSHKVSYVTCSACGHLNGRHDDGVEFWDAMYISGGMDIAEQYVSSSFEDRVRDIYLPKVDFLIEALPNGVTPVLLDIGCGAGFLVDAALQRGVEARGIDVNASMLQFGNDEIDRRRGVRPLECVSGVDFADRILTSEASVLSAIGVIEHLSDLNAFWHAFRSSRFEYLYFSVPMFSLSTVVEHVFPEVAPRNLQSDHTHLFSESSLEHMYELLGVKPVAEWRFGTDIMDLFRSLTCAVAASKSHDLRADLVARLAPRIDELQAVLDKAHYCSEIHVLARRRND